MPAVSKAQQRFAGMSKTASGRKALKKSGKKPMPPKIADEFATTGSTGSLPTTVKPQGPGMQMGGGLGLARDVPAKKKKRKSKRAPDAPPNYGPPKVDKSGRF